MLGESLLHSPFTLRNKKKIKRVFQEAFKGSFSEQVLRASNQWVLLRVFETLSVRRTLLYGLNFVKCYINKNRLAMINR